jgi:hypothetical protein
VHRRYSKGLSTERDSNRVWRDVVPLSVPWTNSQKCGLTRVNSSSLSGNRDTSSDMVISLVLCYMWKKIPSQGLCTGWFLSFSTLSWNICCWTHALLRTIRTMNKMVVHPVSRSLFAGFDRTKTMPIFTSHSSWFPIRVLQIPSALLLFLPSFATHNSIVPCKIIYFASPKV